MVSYPSPPYKIKVTEPISQITKEERLKAIKRAHYNLFNLRSEEIYIDFLTDSGTGAMSQEQWGAMMKADESYANAKSFERFQSSVQQFTGMSQVLPAHQGRAAENVLFGYWLQDKPDSMVVSNQSFDTTVGHILYNNAKPVDIVIDIPVDEYHPFKGNMDVKRLKHVMDSKKEKISMITLVLTNNAGGGQPVSIANIEQVSQIAEKNDILFALDIARIVENAYFIQQRENGYQKESLADIVRLICSYADVVWMSAKKDGLVNIGGFIALNDEDLANRLRERLILFEGFSTYGGLAGRDLEAIAVGLREVVTGDTMKHRIKQTNYLVESLAEAGIPVVKPAGGHAAFIDAGAMLPHIPPSKFPGQALATRLYIEGGIRSVEIGSLMFGKFEDDEFIPAKNELVRLAIPRRSYTQAHFDYVVDIVKSLLDNKDEIKGLEITEEPEILRHFSCKLKPVSTDQNLILGQ